MRKNFLLFLASFVTLIALPVHAETLWTKVPTNPPYSYEYTAHPKKGINCNVLLYLDGTGADMHAGDQRRPTVIFQILSFSVKDRVVHINQNDIGIAGHIPTAEEQKVEGYSVFNKYCVVPAKKSLPPEVRAKFFGLFGIR